MNSKWSDTLVLSVRDFHESRTCRSAVVTQIEHVEQISSHPDLVTYDCTVLYCTFSNK